MEREHYRRLPHRDNDNCFACSPHNAAGLKLSFFTDGEKVVSWFRVPAHLSGWDRIFHGGLIATMLDEVMGWTTLHILKQMTLTRKITVEFLKPVFVGDEVRIEGKPFEVRGKREAVIQGLLFNQKEELCARARGHFALFTIEAIRARSLVDERVLREVEHIIEGSKQG